MRPTRSLGLLLTVACTAVVWAQQPTFRSSVDLITVDVQVIDRDGAPVIDLQPDQFAVTIDGKRRRVSSASLVGIDAARMQAPAAAGAPARASTPADEDSQLGRVYILTFDTGSFPALGIEPAREAARAFVSQLRPNDRVGLLVLPRGPAIDVTTDRGRILTALSQVVGQAAPVSMGLYQLTPSDIVDLGREIGMCSAAEIDPLPCLRRADPMAVDRLLAICTDPEEQLFCIRNVLMDSKASAQLEEADILDRVVSLRSMMRFLGQAAQRKIIVLVSAGIMASDRGDGRPNVGDVGRLVGQTAAESNASVYTLFVDRVRLDQATASRRTMRPSMIGRDSEILSRPLRQIADTSGGAFFNVVQGGGEVAFQRILKETSAYYLLGVQPEPQDRDGRQHQLKVSVGVRDVTVRGRSWFVLPKARTPIAVPPGMTAAAAAETSAPPLVLRSPPTPVPARLKDLVDAYARHDGAATDRALGQPDQLANMQIDYRGAEGMWPEAPRRYRALALELASYGLASRNGYARDEGARLLAQAHVLVERLGSDDAFGCAWFAAEAAILEGLWQPDFALPYVTRAATVCSRDPRLALAKGVILDQLTRRANDPAQVAAAMAAYNAVPRATPAGFEAGLRAASLAQRTGNLGAARAAFPESDASAPDNYLKYLYYFVRGEIFRASVQPPEAEAAYRRALELWPGAQSSRVALMTLLIESGRPADASVLAGDVQRAAEATDPWWSFSRGDFRQFPALRDAMRRLVE